jgi:predicted butyrate kinase (DUF1464 family)
MPRVAGTDPGTSSLDLLVLEDGRVAGQARFTPDQLQADPGLPVQWLIEQGPFDLIAGPSGYGLPLVRAQECSDRDLDLMALVRPNERNQSQGVIKFSSLLRIFRAAPLPVVFLPGVLHLPTIPAHRKINRIDLGTADKLCVAALALHQQARRLQKDFSACHCCVIELGSAFTACMVIQGGHIVDGLGGTCGPIGWRSGGALDGELAYLLSPLRKGDLFTGGVLSHRDPDEARLLFREALVKAVASFQAVTPFEEIVLSGRLLEIEPDLAAQVAADLARRGTVARLEPLPGAWVKAAAQGAALLADGLAGGTGAALVERLALREAGGTVLDWIVYPRGPAV